MHVHVWRHPHVFQVIGLKNELEFKAILHVHAPFHKLSQLGMSTWAYHKVIDHTKKASLKKYDVIIALTPHERDILIKKFGTPERKIVVIHNGINDKIDNFTKMSLANSQTVLYIGRISKSKNIELLVKAMEHVNKEKRNAKLLLAGPDEGLIVKLKNYAHKHGVNIDYLNVVTDEQKAYLYNQCTLFAHPAVYEPFGITLLEAQAFGKPCVITGNGGQIYIAPPGRTSIYAKPNPKSFGKAISLLLDNNELYNNLSINATNWALEYLWSKTLPEYDRLYDRTCQ